MYFLEIFTEPIEFSLHIALWRIILHSLSTALKMPTIVRLSIIVMAKEQSNNFEISINP